MAKKGMAILLALLLTLALTGCTASNQHYYEQAQLYLGSGEFESAAMLFGQLGEYADAADYTLYCAALTALSKGDLELARRNFELVLPFKSSDRYLTYIEALRLENEGQLDKALALWEELGSFENSDARAAMLREAIPSEEMAHAEALMAAGHYEQAKAILEALNGYGDSARLMEECETALLRAAYDRAEALYAGGQFELAQSAFEALGDHLDAARRALECRAAMYEALEEAFPRASMATAPALIDGYAEMEDYAESEARLEALLNRYAVNLSIVANAHALPWILFGQYPAEETGAPAPLLWRLVALDGATATLLCDRVIDAMPATSLPALMLSADEQQATISLSLPLLTDLTALAQSDLRCAATPYALAQGVRHHSDGSAWWWLGNPVGAGRNAVIWYNGRALDTGVSATESVVGVRPLIRLDLDEIVFTSGDGSAEHPFRQ